MTRVSLPSSTPSVFHSASAESLCKSESNSSVGSSTREESTSNRNGFKLALMKTVKNALWFLSKLTCGLIRDPYRCRKAGDFLSAKEPPLSVARVPDSQGLEAKLRKPDRLEKIVVPPHSSVDEKVDSMMKENSAKRKELGALLLTRKNVLETTERCFDYCKGPEAWCGELNKIVREEFVGFEKTSTQVMWASDLSRRTALETFFAMHFAAHFAPSLPEKSEIPAAEFIACKQKMEETYFTIFKEIVNLVAGKGYICDTSKCHDIFVEVRKEALRDVLWKRDKDLNGEQIAVLIQQCTNDFENKTGKLAPAEKNNPLFLRAVHKATGLRPLAGMTQAFIDSVNQSLSLRTPAGFLLSRMACELIVFAQQGDPEAPPPCVTGEALPPRLPVHEMIIQREKIFKQIVRKIEKATSAEGDLGDDNVHVRTPQEAREVRAVRKIGELFKRNQAALLVRMEGNEECENAFAIFSLMHYGMPPLCEGVREGDFPDKRYLDALKQAQMFLSERMVAFGIEKETGTKLEVIPVAGIEELFYKYFQEQAASALRGFMQSSPEFQVAANLSEAKVVGEFERAFERALSECPAAKDYINDRLVVAHQTVLSEMSGLDDRVFQSLEYAMRPSVLLARASEQVVEAIARTSSKKAEKAAAPVRNGVRKREVDHTFVGKLIAMLEEDRNAR